PFNQQGNPHCLPPVQNGDRRPLDSATPASPKLKWTKTVAIESLTRSPGVRRCPRTHVTPSVGSPDPRRTLPPSACSGPGKETVIGRDDHRLFAPLSLPAVDGSALFGRSQSGGTYGSAPCWAHRSAVPEDGQAPQAKTAQPK